MSGSQPVGENILKTESVNSASILGQGLEQYELEGDGRPPFILTYTEVKLLGIAGVHIFRLSVSVY
jgi:hypothetical protein